MPTWPQTRPSTRRLTTAMRRTHTRTGSRTTSSTTVLGNEWRLRVWRLRMCQGATSHDCEATSATMQFESYYNNVGVKTDMYRIMQPGNSYLRADQDRHDMDSGGAWFANSSGMAGAPCAETTPLTTRKEAYKCQCSSDSVPSCDTGGGAVCITVDHQTR